MRFPLDGELSIYWLVEAQFLGAEKPCTHPCVNQTLRLAAQRGRDKASPRRAPLLNGRLKSARLISLA